MKKVRFESPCKTITCARMSDLDCHSPRPFLENTIQPKILDYYTENTKNLVYSPDPVHRFETSNSVPYPTVSKLYSSEATTVSKYLPSNELDLSMLDANNHIPRRNIAAMNVPCISTNVMHPDNPKALSPIDNAIYPSESVTTNNDFFIRRENIDKNWKRDLKLMPKYLGRINLDKENNPLEEKQQIILRTTKSNEHIVTQQSPKPQIKSNLPNFVPHETCACHHCNAINRYRVPHQGYNVYNSGTDHKQLNNEETRRLELCQNNEVQMRSKPQCHECPCRAPPPPCHCQYEAQEGNTKITEPAICNNNKKSWKLERLQLMNDVGKDSDNQINVTNENREPTVADLFAIIKLQNQQLQLLQDKVDKFISASKYGVQSPAVMPNCVTEHVIETVTSKPQMSIGVMTSFEMVRTSTIINKEILTKTTDNAQVQCNRSQISIKEVISRTQPVNVNFLDGIPPKANHSQGNSSKDINGNEPTLPCDVQEEKTLNELSLYNVQVENPITPLISPDQSLYLDVRDYSDSDSTSSNQSNVGWTYYNKVMTHVNGMLQDSDMPSSASALFRNMKQQCVQMQIDKTNISVAKRVKFGDDPLGIQQPHIYGPSTETSLKMNELAAKYLKGKTGVPMMTTTKPVEMSFATRNYLEKHKILQGLPPSSKSPTTGALPRFLDITALKNQPKLL